MARKPTTDKLRLLAIKGCTKIINTNFNHVNRSGKIIRKQATDLKQQTQKTLKKALKQVYRDAKDSISTRNR